MNYKQISILWRKIKAFLIYSPFIFKEVLKLWNMLEEIYNEQTLKELEEVKRNKLKENKEK